MKNKTVPIYELKKIGETECISHYKIPQSPDIKVEVRLDRDKAIELKCPVIYMKDYDLQKVMVGENEIKFLLATQDDFLPDLIVTTIRKYTYQQEQKFRESERRLEVYKGYVNRLELGLKACGLDSRTISRLKFDRETL